MFTTNIARRIYYFSKINKVVNNISEALADIKDNSKILVGGFGICGIPMNLIAGLRDKGVKDLTIVSNNCGIGDKQGKNDWGLGILLRSKQIKRMISSYVGQNVQFQRQYLSGQLQLQITPQGTLAQKIRSGGAGIPAFYTATGIGTMIQYGGFQIKYKKGSKQVQISAPAKPVKIFNGKPYILQQAIFGDFALIKAKKADTLGNLYFNKTANNFNTDMATAATCVIAEVQQIVEPGQVSPQCVHVPAVYVNRIFKSDPNCVWSQKKIQKLTILEQNQKDQSKDDEKKKKQVKIIKRAAKQVGNGMNVNVGIGIPNQLPSVLPKDLKINFHSENGIFGVGPYPTAQKVDPDLINMGKQTITILYGGSLFSSSTSFGIIRGGHLDLTMLGAFQVSRTCDIANWIIPEKLVKGMGGAMDLVACGSKVIILMEHCNKNKLGQLQKKLLGKCNLPLTAKGVVSMVITQLAVFQNINGQLILTEIADQTTLEQVQSQTDFDIKCSAELKRF